jgi:hypothetical protein
MNEACELDYGLALDSAMKPLNIGRHRAQESTQVQRAGRPVDSD